MHLRFLAGEIIVGYVYILHKRYVMRMKQSVYLLTIPSWMSKLDRDLNVPLACLASLADVVEKALEQGDGQGERRGTLEEQRP